MREAWRWFGPGDPVTINDIRQTEVTDIVSALHDIPAGEPWPLANIREHQALIETCEEWQAPLVWSVVESIPVHEDIKLALPGCELYVDNWITSMENLAACGIKTICYNFMPVLDWTRTDLAHQLPSGGYALRFDQQKFAAFDLCILQRAGAEQDYTTAEIEVAQQLFSQMTGDEQALLTHNIIAGLPGKMTDAYGLETFRAMLARYQGMDANTLRNHLFAFLERVLPVAERLGVKLAIHPDDPPRDMFGLPRIICTADDLDTLFAQVPSPSNGITLCAGTYGSRPDNDLPEMAKKFAARIHFSHLRGVIRDAQEPRSFYEASHLNSDVDIVSVIAALLSEERRRNAQEGASNEIFIRPDHGHQILDDIGKSGNPGYSCIGRLKGLAEIRGVVKALESVL
jgi:mannonate dehydratase